MLLSNLFEAGDSNYEKPEESASVKELVKLLQAHCKNSIPAIKKDNVLFRGWQSPKPSGIYNPSTGSRSSENTTNFYTELFDTNPANSAWPKRSKSFICTTKESRAWQYAGGRRQGSVSVVVPFDGVDVARCNFMDVWYYRPMSGKFFTQSPPSIVQMNEMLRSALGGSGGIPFNTLRKRLEGVGGDGIFSWKDNFQLNVDTAVREDELADDSSNLEDLERLTPEFIDNFVDSYTYDEHPTSFDLVAASEAVDDRNREVWFSGKCVMFDSIYLDHVKRYL